MKWLILVIFPSLFQYALLTDEFCKFTNEFSLRLFQATLQKFGEDNVVISPTDISLVLSLLLEGTIGSTHEELKQILNNNIYNQRSGFEKYMHSVSKSENLKIANKISINPLFTLNENFKSILMRIYSASVDNAFRGDIINEWVSQATNQRIQNIVSDDEIVGDLILLSALYFKNEWKIPFHSKLTGNGYFHISPNQTVVAPFMRSTRSLIAARSDWLGVKFVKIPYKDNRFEMIIMLPTGDTTVKDVVDKLDEDVLKSILTWNEQRSVKIKIPKFELKTRSSLKEILQSMGAKRLFEYSEDFSSIMTSAEGEMLLSNIIHETFFKIDENGTEAAAASSVVLTAVSSITHKKHMKLFINRPFLFIVNDNRFNVPIFMGQVTDISR